MQTFVPYPDYDLISKVLDWRRLGKQRVESYQILKALESNIDNAPWSRHPATKMWKGHEGFLCLYSRAICSEWIRRGYVDNLIDRFQPSKYPHQTPPSWWGDDRVHRSHRSQLLRKDPYHYTIYFLDDTDDLEYFWPSKQITY